MNNLLILIDYNSEFLISLNNRNEYVSMDVNKLEQLFISKGFNVKVIEFSNLDFNNDYSGYFVLYQTSEAIGQFYKKYIEDIIYYLQMTGAKVLPDYRYLKAHHNKGFMELLRSNFSDDSLKTISSKYYGAAIDALKAETKLPIVIKQISGSGSTGVYCAKTNIEYKNYVKKASRTIIGAGYYNLYSTVVKDMMKKILSIIDSKYYVKISEQVQRPIIVQNLIQGLSGDYKVLYFGGKYYTLYRENRKNDFRASGGGLLKEVPMEENEPLLDFAQKLVREIDFPIIGMDIGFDGNKYHLIEFQMIHLGPYTLQRSNYHFIWNNNQWKCINEKSDLEEEFTRSICEHIENKYNINGV
jgi:glutathione synthase/RimK-type ligase-like ATP-grasp enzyme